MKKCFNNYILLLLLYSGFTFAQVGIGTITPATTFEVQGNPSDVTLRDGITIPKITCQELIAKHTGGAAYGVAQTGTLVYITEATASCIAAAPTTNIANLGTPGFYVFNGVEFEKVSYDSSSWTILGNAGTNPLNNFMGTTDLQAIAFRTNNIEKMRLFSLSNPSLGLGRNDLTGVNGGASSYSGPTLFLGSAGNISSSTGLDFIIDDDNNATSARFTFKTNGDGETGTVELMQINENGNVGIGAGLTPTAQLHTTGTVLFEGLAGVGTRVVTADATGNLATATLTNGTVTSVSGTAPISVANGTTTPVISLDDLGVTTLKLADDSVTSAKILDGTVANADLANMTALSVKGNATNASAVPTDIAAGTDGHILRRSGTTLGFGTIASAGITDGTIVNADLSAVATGVGGIYKGSGSLSGATTVTQGTNTLNFTSTATTQSPFSITANSLTTGTALALSSTSSVITTGKLLSITGNNISTGTLAEIQANGLSSNGIGLNITSTTNNSNGRLLNISYTGANLGSSARLFNIEANNIAAGSGILASVSGTNLTTGAAFSVTSNAGNGLTSNGRLMRITGDSQTSGTLATFSGNGLTSGTALEVSVGSALTAAGKALSVTTGNITAGSGIDITTGTLGTSGKALSISSNNNAANTEGVIKVTNTAASGAGIFAALQANATAGSGLTILNNGNVGIGTASPTAQLHTTGTVLFEGLAGVGTRVVTADATGNLATATLTNGTVTSVSGTAPISVANGTTTPVISLDDLGVTTLKLADNSITSAKILDGTVANADLANMTALSVKGNATNASAVPTDIATGTDGDVLRRSGTTLGFGTIASAGITDGTIVNADLSAIATGVGGIYKGSGTTPASAVVVSLPTSGTLAINPSGTQVANQFSIDGTSFSVDALNNRVGIGTAAPSQSLEIAGTTYVNAENSAITIDYGGASRLGFVKKTGGGPFIASGYNVPIIFSQLSTFGQQNILENIGNSFVERMRIDGNGNVGIGGSIPTNLLHLSGPTNFPAGNLLRYVQITNFNTGNTSTDGTIIGINAAGETQINNRETLPIVFSTTNTERMRIDASGNIGIGIASPTAQLHSTGTVRFEDLGTNTANTNILTTDVNGNVTTRDLSNLLSGNAVTSLNGLTNSIQTFATGTSGTDFNISSLTSTHTFNFPNASATNRGLLTSTDWTTFNNKIGIVTATTPAAVSTVGTTATINNTAANWNANQLQGSNVSTTAPNSDGQLLTWDDTNSNWEPRTSVINNLAEIYLDTGSFPLTTDNTFQDIAFTSNGIVDSDFTTSTTSITVSKAGRYEITYRATVFNTSSTMRSGAEFYLDIDNGTEAPGTRSYTYNRFNDVGYNTVTTIKILDLDAGSVVKVRGRNYVTAAPLNVVNGSSLIVKRLK